MKYSLLAMTFIGLISFSASAENNRADYDLDDDGLIEINDLQDLNDIRNSPTGSMLYGSNYGCPATGCVGYELTKDLDFDTSGDGVFNAADSFWDGGAGWLAIPEFNAVFDGNGYVIKNLTINRPTLNAQALFSQTNGAQVRHLGIQNVYIYSGTYLSALIGRASNTKVNGVFVTGSVIARPIQEAMLGGLAGYGGANLEFSNILSLVNFGGPGYYVGGVIGYTVGPGITIRSVLGVNQRVDQGRFSITGNGSQQNSTIVNSYWFGYAGREGSLPVDSYPVTIDQLKCPTSSDDVYCVSGSTLYKGWADEKDADGMPYWDFGTAEELPGLILKGKLYRFNAETIVAPERSSSSSVQCLNADSSSSSRTSVSSSFAGSSRSHTNGSEINSMSSSSRSSSSTSSCIRPSTSSSVNSSSYSSGMSSSVRSSRMKASSSSSSSKKKKPKPPKHH
jgi:hypothetical protein